MVDYKRGNFRELSRNSFENDEGASFRLSLIIRIIYARPANVESTCDVVLHVPSTRHVAGCSRNHHCIEVSKVCTITAGYRLRLSIQSSIYNYFARELRFNRLLLPSFFITSNCGRGIASFLFIIKHLSNNILNFFS